MPGPASLLRNEYYGHQQNHFWRIIGEILDFDPGDTYAARVNALREARIAVWDVLRSCERPGALDSSIVVRTAEVNDFVGFVSAHPRLRRIVFNGATAERLFRKRVMPSLGGAVERIDLVRVPSTSPANASIPLSQKLAEWRTACAIWTTSLSV